MRAVSWSVDLTLPSGVSLRDNHVPVELVCEATTERVGCGGLSVGDEDAFGRKRALPHLIEHLVIVGVGRKAPHFHNRCTDGDVVTMNLPLVDSRSREARSDEDPASRLCSRRVRHIPARRASGSSQCDRCARGSRALHRLTRARTAAPPSCIRGAFSSPEIDHSRRACEPLRLRRGSEIRSPSPQLQGR